MALDQVIANIPGMAGYEAMDQINRRKEQQGMDNAVKAMTLMDVLAKRKKQQEMDQYGEQFATTFGSSTDQASQAMQFMARSNPGALAELMVKQVEEQRKLAGYKDFVKSLPENLDPTARAILSNPEIARTVGPGVLPKLLSPKEAKPLEWKDSRFQYKSFPDMAPDQAAAYGLEYRPGYGAIAKSPLDKPVQVNVGGVKPQYDVDLQERLAEAKARGAAKVKKEGAQEKEAMLTEGIKQRADIVMDKVDEAIKLVSPMTTGFVGDVRSTLPGRLTGSGAYDLEKTLDTIKANIGFGELQAMRQASPTGGALGQVAVQELNMLQAVLGSIEKGQDPKILKNNLRAIKKHYQNWKDAVDKASKGETSMQAESKTPERNVNRTWSDAQYNYRELSDGTIQRKAK